MGFELQEQRRMLNYYHEFSTQRCVSRGVRIEFLRNRLMLGMLLTISGQYGHALCARTCLLDEGDVRGSRQVWAKVLKKTDVDNVDSIRFYDSVYAIRNHVAILLKHILQYVNL